MLYVDFKYHIGLFNYVRPDFAVVCNQINKIVLLISLLLWAKYTLLKYTLLIEIVILKKLEIYKNQATINEIFMIEQEKIEIVVHRKRSQNIWEKTCVCFRRYANI